MVIVYAYGYNACGTHFDEIVTITIITLVMFNDIYQTNQLVLLFSETQ